MIPLDAIAQECTTDIDRVYPPMKWVARWSTGDNIPHEIATGPEFVRAFFRHILRKAPPDWYEPGLWIFSDDGPRALTELGREHDGRTVKAWTSREAIARFRASP